jgi:hypothetical protein
MTMKLIPLSHGVFAQVSDRDYPRLREFNWTVVKRGRTWYAYRHVYVDGKRTGVGMHRDVLGLVRGDGVLADHGDGNGLNNQRRNLRRASSTQNCRNKRVYRNKTGFKGVRLDASGSWRASITVSGKRKHLGRFWSPEGAHQAYVRAAKKYFGRFAGGV